jgi:uncharacterized integral membrane protein (TIGR00697 family)
MVASYDRQLPMAGTITVVGILPGEPEWAARVGQEAYNNIFSLTPRIVAASRVAYLAGSFANAYIMARLKALTGGRRLWLRTIGSTVVGEAFDTVLFVAPAFAFAEGFSGALLWSIFLSNYSFKVGVEVIFTPLTYAITGFTKRVERSDVFDTQTNFTPFRLRARE